MKSSSAHGATRFGAITLIIVPVAVPGLLSAAIFAFTLSWDGGVLRRFMDTPTWAWSVSATPSSPLP